VTPATAARLSLASYDDATVEIGNSAALVELVDGHQVIAFRGTNDGLDVLHDLIAFPWKPDALNVWVHRGFWAYTNNLIEPLTKLILRRNLPVHLTGHSLGGAAALIFAAYCQNNGIKISGIHTFGAPRAGYESLASKTYRIPGNRYVIEGDAVPSVPPSWFAFPYTHDRPATMLPGIPGIIDHPMSGYVEAL